MRVLDWSAELVVGILGVAVAIVAIPITLWGASRWGERRARVLFTYHAVPILPTTDQQGLLRVTYRDADVPAPHLVTLRLRNTGRRDVSSDRFDGGRPLLVNLNARLYGIVNWAPVGNSGILKTSVLGADDDGYVEFVPQLLPKGHEWTAELLVSGSPTPELGSHLIDTDIVVAKEGSPSALDEFAANLVGGLVPRLIRSIGV